MDKTITADFSSGKKQISITGLWQYDHGLSMEIRGFNFGEDNEVHFAEELSSENAITVKAARSANAIVCKIPDSLLQRVTVSLLRVYIISTHGFM